ncbi:MAG: PEP-CTERM sorting domain-containing protein [Verrucomicrobiales bacterium]
MKNALVVSAISLFTLTCSSDAAISVTGNNLGGSGRILADAAGTPLPAGSLIRVGFFNDPVADIAVISGTDFSSIDQLFKSLGEGVANSGTLTDGSLAAGVPTAGRFSFTISGAEQSYLPPNKLMFLWVFNASSAASATQWALITNNDSNDGDLPWLSKVDDVGIPGSGNLSLPMQQAQVDDASDVVTGSIVGNQLRLEVVPEPSLAALCLSATGALLLRRRRATS